jgi:serine/threonine-protein kinase
MFDGKGLEKGTVLADTYVVDALARADFDGTLLSAHHARLPAHRVTVKLSPSRGLDEAQTRRFRREAELCARLHHPSIAAIEDLNYGPDGRPFIVFEHFDGETLQSRVDRAPLNHGAAMEIVRLLGAAIQHAHDEGILHRALSPATLVLAEAPDKTPLKVIGFGYGKVLLENTTSRGQCISLYEPRYLAPEQVRGDTVDTRCDQYSLAAIAYELLTRRAWIRGNELSEILESVARGPKHAAIWNDVAAPVRGALERALALSPEDRFASVSDLLGALGESPREPVPLGAISRNDPLMNSDAVLLARQKSRWARRKLALASILLGIGIATLAWLLAHTFTPQ